MASTSNSRDIHATPRQDESVIPTIHPIFANTIYAQDVGSRPRSSIFTRLLKRYADYRGIPRERFGLNNHTFDLDPVYFLENPEQDTSGGIPDAETDVIHYANAFIPQTESQSVLHHKFISDKKRFREIFDTDILPLFNDGDDFIMKTGDSDGNNREKFLEFVYHIQSSVLEDTNKTTIETANGPWFIEEVNQAPQAHSDPEFAFIYGDNSRFIQIEAHHKNCTFHVKATWNRGVIEIHIVCDENTGKGSKSITRKVTRKARTSKHTKRNRKKQRHSRYKHKTRKY